MLRQLRQRGRRCSDGDYEQPALSRRGAAIDRNRLLYSGRTDVVVDDRRIVRYFEHELSEQVDATQSLDWFGIFPPTPYRIGFRLDEQRLRFDEGLRRLRESGDYRHIEQRYLAD